MRLRLDQQRTDLNFSGSFFLHWMFLKSSFCRSELITQTLSPLIRILEFLIIPAKKKKCTTLSCLINSDSFLHLSAAVAPMLTGWTGSCVVVEPTVLPHNDETIQYIYRPALLSELGEFVLDNFFFNQNSLSRFLFYLFIFLNFLIHVKKWVSHSPPLAASVFKRW